MTDTVVASIITVGGMTVVAVISVISQFFVTRFIVRSEHDKVLVEHKARRLEATADRLTDTLAELLSESDPEVNADISYERVVTLIHRAQLLLDRTKDDEAALCRAINKLGLELQKYAPHHRKPAEERLAALKSLLGVHAEVADIGGQFLQSRGRMI